MNPIANQATFLRPSLDQSHRVFPVSLVVLLVSAIALGATYYLQDSIFGASLSFLVFTISVLAIVGFELIHPVVWFLPVFTLYSLSAPLLARCDILSDPGNYGEVIFLHQVAAVSFVLAAGVRHRDFSLGRPIKTNGIAPIVVIGLGVAVVGLNLFVILTSGSVVGKGDILLDSGKLGAASFGPNIVLAGFVMFFVSLVGRYHGDAGIAQRRRLLLVSTGVTIALFVLVLSVTGQRKIVFAAFIAMLLLKHVFISRVSLTQVSTLSLALVALIPIAAWNKNVLLRLRAGEDVYAGAETDRDTIIRTAAGEFRASGENLSILIQNVYEARDFRWGQGTLEEFESILLPNVLRGQQQHSSRWFAEEFFANLVDRGETTGFSLVGFGYLEAGTWGVVLLFAALGGISQGMYRAASRSHLMLVFYLCYTVFSSICMRQGFAVILSPMLKHVLIPIACGFACEVLMRPSRGVSRRAPTVLVKPG